MIMVGARTSIAVALVAVGIGMGHRRSPRSVCRGRATREPARRDHHAGQRSDLRLSQSLLIAIMITAVFGASALNAIIAIGIFNIPVFARLTRGAALSLWTRDYVLAARVARARARCAFQRTSMSCPTSPIC
jgi:peptide/nickel transport system permease protein